MKNIAMLVNSEDMMECAQSVVAETGDNIRLIATRTYEESLRWGKQLEEEGCRILIARGGHAQCLRNSDIGIPIVNLAFTGNNITSILLQASNTWQEFAVVGNSTLIQITKQLEPSLHARITCCAIQQWQDFERQVLNMRDRGIPAIVGGYDACRFAKKYGLYSYCITTNQFEIKTAIADAKTLLATLDRETRWSDMFRSVLDNVREGVAIVNTDYVVTHLNRLGKKFLSDFSIGKEIRNPLYRQRIDNALTTGGCSYDELTEADNYKYTCTTIPIRTGDEISEIVFMLQEVEYVRKMEQKVRQKIYDKGLVASKSFEDILGSSAITEQTIQIAKRYALVNSTVLITGESGTGKEIYAQSIHNFSARRNEAFVAVNCASIAENLLESELFGYVEGAFTGARRNGKVGLFELAHKGTIFLDEIGEMSLEVQARLLRVLEERQIMRIGDDHVIPINIRVIAATNKDLQKMVEDGKFRSDLYYRLNVLPLKLQPLRKRKEDLRALIEHFSARYADEYNRTLLQFTEEGMDVMMQHSWKGNTRELRNVIERLTVTNTTGIVDEITAQDAIGISSIEAKPKPVKPKSNLIGENEQKLIFQILEEVGGNKTEAAKRLGISRPTLHRKLKQMEDQ